VITSASSVRPRTERPTDEQTTSSGEDNLGALNMFSSWPGAFGEHSERVGWVLASHAAVALVNSRHATDMGRALDSARAIGEAIGIVMSRYHETEEQALDRLVHVSQNMNTNPNLRELAQEINRIGEIRHRGRGIPNHDQRLWRHPPHWRGGTVEAGARSTPDSTPPRWQTCARTSARSANSAPRAGPTGPGSVRPGSSDSTAATPAISCNYAERPTGPAKQPSPSAPLRQTVSCANSTNYTTTFGMPPKPGCTAGVGLMRRV
jgi:ANTAR domain